MSPQTHDHGSWEKNCSSNSNELKISKFHIILRPYGAPKGKWLKKKYMATNLCEDCFFFKAYTDIKSVLVLPLVICILLHHCLFYFWFIDAALKHKKKKNKILRHFAKARPYFIFPHIPLGLCFGFQQYPCFNK